MGHAIHRALALSTLSICLVGGPLTAMPAAAGESVEQGRKIAFDRKKGNCLACHLVQGASLPGNIGPPLLAMKSRFPDKAKLRAQVWDATVANPNSLMPPFGKHGVLTEQEIDLVVDYIHTL